jgi:putative ABC transport system substrate-binding protein
MFAKMRFIFIFLCLLIGVSIYSIYSKNSLSSKKTVTIGVVVPLEHQALKEIVDGFKEALAEEVSLQKVTLKVQNAQGDMNLQRSILQQMIQQNIDYIVPIGGSTTQMALALGKGHNIISLAYRYEDLLKDQAKNSLITGVCDEISPSLQIQFITEAMPNLNKITLIHSPSDKIFAEIEGVEKAFKANGIAVQKLMIQTLADLYSVSKRVDQDSNAIFVLKDHMVVSGIRTLVQEAEKLQIPLITSDEGSIQGGGAFALGVKERDTGVQGGKLLKAILRGNPIKDFPAQQFKDLTLFINQNSCQKMGVSINGLLQTAETLKYNVEKIDQLQRGGRK